MPGNALGGDVEAATFVGTEEARIGQEWLFALPLPYNKSDRELTITGANVVDVPSGLTVRGVSAHALKDTGGEMTLLARIGATDPVAKELEAAKDLSKKPNRIKRKSLSSVYYVARIKVIGPVASEVEKCRFTYRQANKQYAQVVGCRLQIQLKG
ncbi:hypothetical protein ACH4UY_36375 [Streptomyces longwoodensis]|uniref:hypothetical protein n=1 Tax=Streptomyces longwoodensis TaxID=68231 RepID=UPI00379AA903